MTLTLVSVPTVFHMSEAPVHIGELSRRTRVSPRSLRYYERHGLVQARRTQAGWREYDQEVVVRVRNIQELLRAGMTVQDLRSIVACLDETDPLGCDRVDEAIEFHRARLEVIEERMATLQRQHDDLTGRIARLRASRPHRDEPAGGQR